MAKVDLFDDFARIAQAAGPELSSDEPVIFHRLDWFRLLGDHCPPGPLLAARADAGDMASWLFLARQGRTATGYANFYSLRYDLCGAPSREAATDIARALRSAGLASVEMSPIEDPSILTDAFRQAGWICSVSSKTMSWRVDIESADFEAYWARRPSRLRNTARRKSRSSPLTTRIVTDFAEEAWRAYEQVYRASWKPEEGSFPFLRSLAESESRKGRLRLGFADLDGEPVAAQLWLVENKTAWIHKLAYSEAHRDLSPGTILGLAMFRHTIEEDKVTRIDYGTGDEGYKADWMDHRVPLWRLSAFNPRSPAGLYGALRSGASNLAGRWRSR